MGFLVDSSIFSTMERRGESEPLAALARAVSFQPVAIASITASELLVGVHRANTPTHRRRREEEVETILSRVPILPLDLQVVRLYAELMAELMAAGRPIGAHDLIIGTTALVHGYGVFTENVRHFDVIPNLEVRQPEDIQSEASEG